MLTLRSGDVTLTVHPRRGGRIGQIAVANQRLLVDEDVSGPAITWGSFPMAPWAGRIRAGRFEFGGVEHQLPINHRDGDGAARAHAIHGLVFDRPWSAGGAPDDDASGDDGSGERSSSDTGWTSRRPLDWEFGGTVAQTIDLHPDRVELTLTIESTGRRLPAEVGWHPWFRKPDRVEFTPSAMYERDDTGLPTGAIVDPSGGPWDDCFVNTDPVILHYSDGRTVHLTSDCDHWVVYDMPSHATCVEPQSGPPDAFNLDPHIVDADTTLRRWLTISW